MIPCTLLSTDAAPAHERVGYWGDLVQRSFGRLRSRTYGDERFRGEIRRFQLGAGFSSAAHFSRMFRQHHGASPRDWRAHGGKISLHSVKE